MKKKVGLWPVGLYKNNQTCAVDEWLDGQQHQKSWSAFQLEETQVGLKDIYYIDKI